MKFIKNKKYYICCPNCGSNILVEKTMLNEYVSYQSRCRDCDDINKVGIGVDDEIYIDTYKKPQYMEPSIYDGINISTSL